MTQKNEKLTQHFIPELVQKGQQPIVEVTDDPAAIITIGYIRVRRIRSSWSVTWSFKMGLSKMVTSTV
ncbi:MAG: hypothetical protein P1V19_25440 [Gimesia sp.]|nr:hypothetical protein [Gimesia sp.]